MDDDSESSNWVIVENIDLTEELTSFNTSLNNSVLTDSDQDSDGSISIISDHPTDSYSEEEIEIPMRNEQKSLQTECRQSSDITSNLNMKIQDQQVNSTTQFQSDQDEEVNKETTGSHHISDEISSTCDTSCKQWKFIDEKSRLDLNTLEKPFYLNCSQEPLLEISENDTDADTESITTSQACQFLVKRDGIEISHISNISERQKKYNRLILGLAILVSSVFIRQYLNDLNENDLPDDMPNNNILDIIAENDKARDIVSVCIEKHKDKNDAYSEHVVEKCVTKRLRKKNKADVLKRTELYLQMKERILDIREKELAEKERQILKKLRKRIYVEDDKEREIERKKIKLNKNKQEFENEGEKLTSKECNKKVKRKCTFDHTDETERKFKKMKLENKYEDFDGNGKREALFRVKTDHKKMRVDHRNKFRKHNSWLFEKLEDTDWKYLKKNDKKKQVFQGHEFGKTNEDETLKRIKGRIKKNIDVGNTKLKKHYTDSKKKQNSEEPSNEEWYIKYNPVKNTIKLINITTLPEQDSFLIKNGNKSINGQWYFSLYGSARTSFRNKERAAEWYFKRATFRESKRDKARWYFDYMSARDDTRYLF